MLATPPLNSGCFQGIPPHSWLCSHLYPSGFFALILLTWASTPENMQVQRLLQTTEAVRGPCAPHALPPGATGLFCPLQPGHGGGQLCHPKLSSSLLALFCSPILIQLLWLSGTACLRGASWGGLCGFWAAAAAWVYWHYRLQANSCHWSERRYRFPGPPSTSPAANPPALLPVGALCKGAACAGHSLPLK